MDLTQRKLTRAEWESIEVPVSPQEKQILHMISKGYQNVNIRTNDTQSMLSFIKIESTPEMEYFLFKKYFEDEIKTMIKKYGKETPIETYSFTGNQGVAAIKSLKSADSIRLQNLDNNIQLNKANIFEYLMNQ